MQTARQDICTNFSGQLMAEFPNRYINVRLRKLVGDDIICVTYANIAKKEDAANGILENAPGFMSFIMFVKSDGSAEIERPVMHYTDKALKFRRITASSEALALDKLYGWFVKNKDIILSSKCRT